MRDKELGSLTIIKTLLQARWFWLTVISCYFTTGMGVLLLILISLHTTPLLFYFTTLSFVAISSYVMLKREERMVRSQMSPSGVTITSERMEELIRQVFKT